MLNQILIVTGPTGVGKTDFVLKLANQIPVEIVNADIGQMYTPLTIGTAKPDWQNETVPHHLFDIINTPIDFSIKEFRTHVEKLIQEIWARGKTPIIVGGSTLYIKSLFYMPQEKIAIENTHVLSLSEDHDKNFQELSLWEKLNQIDPVRASQLHPNDNYRLQRALDIWQQTGALPSTCAPQFQPISANIKLFILNRPRQEIYYRNDLRVHQMMQMGWLNEVAKLDRSWHEFLRRKKIIGYEILLDYLDQKITSQEKCVEQIQQRVRNYAKKQQTFWRSLQKELSAVSNVHKNLFEINLTLLDVDLYIKQLSVELKLD